VIAALRKSFDKDVTPGNKAVKIKANGNRRNADVVVASQFRRYYLSIVGLKHHQGICFFDSCGTQINNYPEQHSANCTAKHQACSEWFKPMVRILKNMRSKLVEDKMIGTGTAPSYFIEGLLYNVPNNKFGNSYASTFTEAINWIWDADRTKFLCANERFYLVRDSAPKCWPTAICNAFSRCGCKAVEQLELSFSIPAGFRNFRATFTDENSLQPLRPFFSPPWHFVKLTRAGWHGFSR